MSAPDSGTDHAAAAAAAAAPAESAGAASAAPAEEEHHEQRVINAELGEMTELESLCPRCEQNGTTRLMITRIPHFRDIIVSSFNCEHCGERNNEVQFGGEFGAKRTRYELRVESKRDLNRQVVKSEYATLTIPELELEVPPQTQRGSINTVEGVLQQTIDGLRAEQPVRRVMQPEVFEKVEAFIARCAAFQALEQPFTLTLDDPAGNSYVEAVHDYYHPTLDPQLVRIERDRTEIDRQLLGLAIDYNVARTREEEDAVDDGRMEGEVMQLDTICSACRKPGTLNMHQCDIPHFKETIIMSFRCEFCGYKSNEVKSGGAVSAKGKRIELRVTKQEDLRRDVLKSDTAALFVPEIELELAPGTLGGFFSTVEGTLNQVKEQLQSLPEASFQDGDSAAVNDTAGPVTMRSFLARIERLMALEEPFTLILDDPLANIYIQNPRAHLPPPEDADPQLVITEYDRTFEQDEELGLHQMNVGEHHVEVAAAADAAAATAAAAAAPPHETSMDKVD